MLCQIHKKINHVYFQGVLLIAGTGNGEPGTGVWERVYSGNPYENSKWQTKTRK